MRTVNVVITIALAITAAAIWIWYAWPLTVGHYTSYYSADVVVMGVTFSAAAMLGWVLVWLTDRHGDQETRCRHCGYILRGLSEPRCPECGERI